MYSFIYMVLMFRIRKIKKLIKAFTKAFKKNNKAFNNAISSMAIAIGSYTVSIWDITNAFPNIASTKIIAKATRLANKGEIIAQAGWNWYIDFVNEEISSDPDYLTLEMVGKARNKSES